VKDIAAGAGTVAVDRSGGVVKADGRATSATTRVASRLLAGAVVSAAGAVAAAAGWVVFVTGEPTAGAAVLGCLRPITAVVPDRGLESAPPVCGVSLLGASGVAAVLAGAVEDVEVGSVSADVVAADSDELVCGPPVATTTPAAPERVRPTSPAGAGPAGVEAAGDDVGRPELLKAIWPGAFSGPRRRPGSIDVEEIVADVSVDASDEELALESAGSANATTGVLASAIPTPARPPTPRRARCSVLRYPSSFLQSVPWRNDGRLVGVEFPLAIVSRVRLGELSRALLQFCAVSMRHYRIATLSSAEGCEPAGPTRARPIRWRA
jgi:hypothetical protein